MFNFINLKLYIVLILLFSTINIINTSPFLRPRLRSPLDDYADYYTDLDDEETPSVFFPSIDDLSKLPLCQQHCSNYLGDALKLLFKTNSYYDKYFGICNKYQETLKCMDETNACATRKIFDILTSGLNYMCVDQKTAFTSVMECVDGAASLVTAECNQQCNTQAKLSTWAMQSGMLEGFKGGKKPSFFNPEIMKSVMQDGCELAECHLGCMKTKFNNRCEGHAGNLITEMLVRPIAKTQEGETFQMLSQVVGMFIPQKCAFMVDGGKLALFRMDPNLEKELLTMYNKNDIEIEYNSFLKEDIHNQTNYEVITLPSKEIFLGKSPLDLADNNVTGVEFTVQGKINEINKVNFNDLNAKDAINSTNVI